MRNTRSEWAGEEFVVHPAKKPLPSNLSRATADFLRGHGLPHHYWAFWFPLLQEGARPMAELLEDPARYTVDVPNLLAIGQFGRLDVGFEVPPVFICVDLGNRESVIGFSVLEDTLFFINSSVQALFEFMTIYKRMYRYPADDPDDEKKTALFHDLRQAMLQADHPAAGTLWSDVLMRIMVEG